MAAAALGVISVLLDAVQLVPYVSNLLAPNAADATTVRIAVGATVDESASFSGNTPGVSLWDFNGNAIGSTDGTAKILPQGNFVDILVNPKATAGNIQAEYISISNGGNDAICIAGLAVTFPDGAKAGFSTNVAAACGAFWSNSKTPVVEQVSSGEVEKPKCIWIDRDGSNGIPHQGMGLHLPSFSNSNKNLATSYSENKDLMCKSGPRFRMYPELRTEDSILVFPSPPEFITNSDDEELIGTDKDPGFIIENPGIPADPLRISVKWRRGVRERDNRHKNTFSNSQPRSDTPDWVQMPTRNPFANRLIISPNKFNSARQLCESPNSFGHSFASLPENLFCDMTDKTLYYICSNKLTTCCLDTDSSSFRACKKNSIKPPTKEVRGNSTNFATLQHRQTRNESGSPKVDDVRTYASVQWW